MPRKPLIRSKTHPYHVTARCNNREVFPSSLSEIWKIHCYELNEISEKFQCAIHAFVLMPNHFHLLISTPNEDLGIVMQNFILSITKKINRNSRRTGRVFGSRYHWSLIDNEHYYDCALKYIYRNPVKAGLSQKVQDYSYSSMKNLLENHFIFRLSPAMGHENNIPENQTEKFLDWMNHPFPNEDETLIKRALQKSLFTPPKIGPNHKVAKLDSFTSMNLAGRT